MTVTAKGVPKASPTVWDCVPPPLMVMVDGVAMATVMLEVVGAILAPLALAVIVVAPVPAPVTGTVTLVAPVAKLMEAGIVTIPVGLELKVMTRPAGAGVERLSVRLVVAVPTMFALAGLKLMVAVTLTGWLADT